jgi:hypothetical protein
MLSFNTCKHQSLSLELMKLKITEVLGNVNIYIHSDAPLNVFVDNLCKASRLVFLPQIKLNSIQMNSIEDQSISSTTDTITQQTVNIIGKSDEDVLNNLVNIPQKGLKLDESKRRDLCKIIIGASRDISVTQLSQESIKITNKLIKYTQELTKIQKQIQVLEKQKKLLEYYQKWLKAAKQHSKSSNVL